MATRYNVCYETALARSVVQPAPADPQLVMSIYDGLGPSVRQLISNPAGSARPAALSCPRRSPPVGRRHRHRRPTCLVPAAAVAQGRSQGVVRGAQGQGRPPDGPVSSASPRGGPVNMTSPVLPTRSPYLVPAGRRTGPMFPIWSDQSRRRLLRAPFRNGAGCRRRIRANTRHTSFPMPY